ncbi:hypothetical protein [Devosia ginsengisoli]|uniref:hypothetical protein n=1 Tax=Devosia ginsengisoli TaxID=400770 RepID=UPI0026EDF80E|nr:hypothetical protein [Devosia ginsengisoli]MCR6672553.1 hypothetical protein [Devosia ginsengisoli]
MKLTWFGGTTIRIYIGGAILVVDAAGAPDGIDAAELVSGADVVIESFRAELAGIDAVQWKPRRLPRLLDASEELPVVEAWAAGPGVVLVDAVGEPPLLLVAGEVPALGRWADGAVMVLFGDGAGLVRRGGIVLDDAPPRLLALAGDEAAIDVAIPALRDRLDGTGLVALEAGMALEV